MNKKNYLRKNCKDVFKSFLVENATYNVKIPARIAPLFQ